MKKSLLFISMIAIACLAFAQDKVDPNHLKTGGYGYLIQTDQTCSSWWAEGSYKVMRDAPVPAKKNAQINLWSAKNEYESFIVVINPKKRMENFRILVSALKDSHGNTIQSNNITVRKVEYVKVSHPTDSYGLTGWWPDPLPEYQHPETITPAENQPFWITIKVPSNAVAGNYSGEVILNSGDWELSVPICLEVWDFALPDAPSMRSGFGLDFGTVKRYENLKTSEDEIKAFENYMKSFSEYKLSPYNPFVYSPIKQEVRGVAWAGGFFDSNIKYAGNYSYRIVDNSATSNAEGRTWDLIPVSNNDEYELSWVSKSLVKDQKYVVGVECYNLENELIPFENRFELFTSQEEWESAKLNLGKFNKEIKSIKIRLFPSDRTVRGENTGTVWFDELSLLNKSTRKNEFPAGNFEVNLDEIDISLDFTDFNKAGKRYFDELNFTAYRLSLKGLGGGTFFSRSKGIFEGFEQGTEEYYKLMERYLGQIENNLEKYGLLGKEYIYWFDEPADRDYPFVRETNELIKKYAPKITTFITEHVKDHDISDVTDISCTIWDKLNHEKISRMNERGLEHWSYLCTGPKSPWITLFTDHDAVNLRMWLWGSYKYRLKGILVWTTNWWNSETASPEGFLQNPWEEAMSFTVGYGRPFGKQDRWGNGDGRFFYPINRNPNHDKNTYTGKPVPSLRLEILRDGIEDYEYFVMLEKAVESASNKNKVTISEAKKLLEIPQTIYTDEKTYSKNPQDMLEYRKKIAEAILKLK